MFWRSNTSEQGCLLYLVCVIKLADVCTYIRIERGVQYQHKPCRGRMSSLEQLMRMVKDHLGGDYSSKWTIGESSLGGRGLIASRDIPNGEVLFVDHALVYGPRAGSSLPRGCTVCGLLESETFFKCSNCALLLCAKECQETVLHQNDCDIISRWSNKVPIEEVDDTVMSKALAVIRVLLLDEEQKQFLQVLEAHKQPRHGFEVRGLKEYFEIPEDEEKLMMHACRVFDTNAFEMGTTKRKEMSMRGLYPVSSLMNSSCVPNIRYVYDRDNAMIVISVKPIPAGTEIHTCYTGLLWGTPSRQLHLKRTKHFLCTCDRCADPTESGTLLSALKCFATECQGSLIPTKPLVLTAAWRCLECDMRVPSKNIFAIQNALGSMLGMLDFKSLDDLENFLLHRVTKFVPKTNQIVVDLELRFIFGTEDIRHPVPASAFWPCILSKYASEPRLALKESLCRGILRVLAALGLGDAHHRGLLLYHLHATLAERARRQPDLFEELKQEIENTIEEAYTILHNDISAPADLELRRRYLGPGCEKPHEERFFILNS